MMFKYFGSGSRDTERYTIWAFQATHTLQVSLYMRNVGAHVGTLLFLVEYAGKRCLWKDSEILEVCQTDTTTPYYGEWQGMKRMHGICTNFHFTVQQT